VQAKPGRWQNGQFPQSGNCLQDPLSQQAAEVLLSQGICAAQHGCEDHTVRTAQSSTALTAPASCKKAVFHPGATAVVLQPERALPGRAVGPLLVTEP